MVLSLIQFQILFMFTINNLQCLKFKFRLIFRHREREEKQKQVDCGDKTKSESWKLSKLNANFLCCMFELAGRACKSARRSKEESEGDEGHKEEEEGEGEEEVRMIERK